MSSRREVEAADQISRKRPIVIAAAAITFALIHVVFRPFFSGPETASFFRREMAWMITAVLLLAGLATGGGILNSTKIRALVNDEVSRNNYRTSVIAGYWVAMAVAMATYLLVGYRALSARDALNIVVSSSIVVALLTFAWLEYRAHRDE